LPRADATRFASLFPLTVAKELDGLRDERDLLLDERPERPEPPLLLGVVGGEGFELVESIVDGVEAGVVRLEEALVAGDQIATLAGLDVAHGA
jgi:hypothetical protein